VRFISTKVHGVLDYSVGSLIMVSPWLFGFNYGGAETWIPFALGLTALLISPFTDYELSVSKKIPLILHLILDFLSGVFLLVSPWLFGFADSVYLPHVVFGLLEIVVVLNTQVLPPYDMSRERDI
jgi:SPW repeat